MSHAPEPQRAVFAKLHLIKCLDNHGPVPAYQQEKKVARLCFLAKPITRTDQVIIHLHVGDSDWAGTVTAIGLGRGH